MTDLLPRREGQAVQMTICEPGPCGGHWYSPAKVALLIEEARKDERTPWAEDCYRLTSQLNNITCIVAEAKAHLAKVGGDKYPLSSVPAASVKGLIADLEAALVAKENK